MISSQDQLIAPQRAEPRVATRWPAVGLLAAIDWRIAPPFGGEGERLTQQISRMGAYIRTQARAALDAAGVPAAPHILCSTMLSRVVVDVPERAALLLRAAAVSEAATPLALLSIYECAGWGYAIRFFEDFMTGPHLLVSIADADFHDLNKNLEDVRIGRLGFGLTTLLLSVSPRQGAAAEPAGPFPDGGLREFMRALRTRSESVDGPTFIPFLKPELRELAERLVGRHQLSPNLHDAYGHCFGSDPWIGIMDWVAESALQAPRDVLAGTIAINGYYAVCRVGVTPDTWFERRDLTAASALRPDEIMARLPALRRRAGGLTVEDLARGGA